MTILVDNLAVSGETPRHAAPGRSDAGDVQRAAVKKLAALLAEGYSRMPMFP